MSARFTDVVFDLDGTLIDSYRDIAAALNETLRALDQPERDPEEVKKMIGGGVGVLLERGLGSHDPHLIERARATFRRAYAARLTDTTRLYEGITELLEALRALGVRCSVATNKPAMFTRPILDHLAIDRGLITAIACADEAGARKPDPRVVHLALDRARASLTRNEPLEAVYIGDMPIDADTARAVPCPFIGVAWGFDPAGARSSKHEHIAETPRALFDLLQG